MCIDPRPLQLFDGWVDEKSGMSLWPPTFLSDITSFFLSKKDSSHVKDLMKDYKVGKAYEYFVSGWLQEVFIHQLEKTSSFCILRAKCCPSQKLRDDNHDVWVCAEKENGTILAAYCTCTAGLGQTCNHVAALLFRVEAANRFGLSSCTSTACNWKAPSSCLKKVEPSKLKDLNMKKSNRSKKVKSRPLVDEQKKNFHPLESETDLKNTTVDSLAVALRGLLPNACLYKALPKDAQGDTATNEGGLEQSNCRPSEPSTIRPSEPEVHRSSQPSTHILDHYTMQHFVEKFKCQTTCYDFFIFSSVFVN